MTMTKRNYWDTEVFPLVENRHEVGILEEGKNPYKATLSVMKQHELEKLARQEAPPRHCLTCGKVLIKRVRVTINKPDQNVVMSSIEYSIHGIGYWCTLKCLRKSAPKLATALIAIHNIPFAGVQFNTESHHLFVKMRNTVYQALNHFKPLFN